MENNSFKTQGNNVFVHPTAVIYPNVILHDNVYIGPFCIVGEPVGSFYKDPQNHEFKQTEIGENSVLRSNTIIYEGTKIGPCFQTGHHVTIRENTVIGRNCSVGTLSDIQKECEIKDFVRIHSNVFMGEFTKIDSFAWIMPRVCLTNDKYPPHDNLKPVHIGEYAVVCANTTVLPGVEIGSNALIGGASIVTKNVDNNSLAFGTPATIKGRVEDIRDENGNQIFPWKDYLEEDRGYPWQQTRK